MKSKLPLILIAIASIIFFFPLLSLNFAQDDFYCLFMGQAHNLKEYINLFTFKNAFVTSQYNFYRPLTTQFYFALLRNIFGLNPFFFHLISFIFHLFNIYLVFKIAELFFPNKRKLIPILSALFFGINQSQSINNP